MIDSRGRKYLDFSELTPIQLEFFLKYIWNGVGSREYPTPPQFIFSEASKYHDYRYFLGGDEEDQKVADHEFFHKAHDAVRQRPVWKRPFYYSLSYIYFYTLKTLGGKTFEFYPAKAKTWEEFLQHVYNFYDREPQHKDRPPLYSTWLASHK